jgi:outer membrane lipoprotein SlyB
MVSGAIAQFALGQGIGETDVATAFYAVPGAMIGLAIVYAVGVRTGVEAERI